MIVLVFVFAGTIANEKSKKSLELVLTKPLKRSSFILAKFLAGILVVSVIYIISATIFYIYTISILGRFSLLNFIILTLLGLLYLIFVTTLSIFASALSKSSMIAAVIGFLGLIILGIISNLFKIIEKFNPNYLLANYQNIVEKGFSTDYIRAIITTVVIVLILVMISVLVFQKEEIER